MISKWIYLNIEYLKTLNDLKFPAKHETVFVTFVFSLEFRKTTGSSKCLGVQERCFISVRLFDDIHRTNGVCVLYNDKEKGANEAAECPCGCGVVHPPETNEAAGRSLSDTSLAGFHKPEDESS